MKIISNSKIEDFFTRCRNNILNEIEWGNLECQEVNAVLMKSLADFYSSRSFDFNTIFKTEKEDICGTQWFYCDYTLKNNPYNKNIKIPNIRFNECVVENEEIPRNRFARMSWTIPDEKMEFEDYFIYAPFKEKVEIPVLRQDDTLWMSITPAETSSIDPFVDKAHGNVLTFGLGLGYYVYMCLLNDNVNSVTIVEYNRDIIDFFEEFILPQFNTNKNVNIIYGDMYDYYNESFLSNYDYAFVDTWETNETGLDMLNKLFEMNIIPPIEVDYWIEFDCYAPVRMLMFLYFESLKTHTFSSVLSNINKDTDRVYFKKIHRYFRAMDIEIDEPDVLKDFMYNNNVFREILSIKI